jgi:hypothetical protein
LRQASTLSRQLARVAQVDREARQALDGLADVLAADAPATTACTSAMFRP